MYVKIANELGATLPPAVVLTGKACKADAKAPNGTSVYRSGAKFFVGATLARVDRDNRAATFTPESLADATERMVKLLGKTAQLRVLHDAELVSSTEETNQSMVAAAAPADDGSTSAESVLGALRDLAADIFDVPFKLQKCTSNGRTVTVHFQLNGSANSVLTPWNEPLGAAGEVSPLLIEMLSTELSRFAES